MAQGAWRTSAANQLWPQHHVSYDGFSDVAAWVRENGVRACGSALQLSRRRPRSLWHAWRRVLRIRLGVDEDLDGSPDATDLEDTRDWSASPAYLSGSSSKSSAVPR